MIYDVSTLDTKIITLGRRGENLAETLRIDVASWQAVWPDAAVNVIVVRPGDTEAYIANTSVADGVLSWPITAADTANEGMGTFEVRAISGEVVKKSVTATFKVCPCISCTGDPEPPESSTDWVNEVLKAADRAEEAAEHAEESVREALQEAKDSGEFDGADGEPGDDGYSPVVDVTPINGGYRVDITDKNSTKSFDVMDGQDGVPGVDGKDGAPGTAGKDGQNGVSPTVKVDAIDGGHRITITDASGSKTVDVMDGEPGEKGDPGETAVEVVAFSRVNGVPKCSHKYRDLQNLRESKVLIATYAGHVLLYFGQDGDTLVFASAGFENSTRISFVNQIVLSSDESVSIYTGAKPKASSPFKLKLTGAVTAEYDGSEQVTVNIPEGGDGNGTGLPTGGEPHQMLVTDAEGVAKWEERIIRPPEVGVFEVLPECKPVMEESGEEGVITEPLFTESIVAGENYIVYWNGTPYACTAKEMAANDDGSLMMPILGDASVIGLGESTGEPFVIIYVPEDFVAAFGAYAAILPMDGSTEVTLKIERNGIVYHRLSLDYLPEDMYGMVDGEIAYLRETEAWYYSNTPYIQTLFSKDLVVGETYTVIWDGVRYECTAEETTVDGVSGILLANEGIPSIVKYATPKTIGDTYTFSGVILPKDSSETVDATFAVVGAGQVVKKMPEKYLPKRKALYVDYDAIAGVSNVLPAPYTNATLIAQYSFDEAMEMLRNGSPIVPASSGSELCQFVPLMVSFVGTNSINFSIYLSETAGIKLYTFQFT